MISYLSFWGVPGTLSPDGADTFVFTNCTPNADLVSDTQALITNNFGGAGNTLTITTTIFVRVTAAYAAFNLTYPGLPGFATPTSVDFFVVALPNGIN